VGEIPAPFLQRKEMIKYIELTRAEALVTPLQEAQYYKIYNTGNNDLVSFSTHAVADGTGNDAPIILCPVGIGETSTGFKYGSYDIDTNVFTEVSGGTSILTYTIDDLQQAILNEDLDAYPLGTPVKITNTGTTTLPTAFGTDDYLLTRIIKDTDFDRNSVSPNVECHIDGTTISGYYDALNNNLTAWYEVEMLVSQSGTSAPTISVIKNELGGTLSTSREGDGYYFIITSIDIRSYTVICNNHSVEINPSDLIGFVHALYDSTEGSTGTIKVKSFKNDLIQIDDILNNTPFEIKIFIN
jgi:hypothetical protein